MTELTDDEAITMAALLGLKPVLFDNMGKTWFFHETQQAGASGTELYAFDAFCTRMNASGFCGASSIADLSRLWLAFKEQTDG